MLTHLNAQPINPPRVVVLGAEGFIASAIVRHLIADDIEVSALGRRQMDLLSAGVAERLADYLRVDDTLVFASAKVPVRNLSMLQENIAMADAVCSALKRRPVAHMVYLSSDAVYKDSTLPITEQSCAHPSSLHGAMHLTREIALETEYPGPLVLVRPTLAYGIDDPHNGYGPNRFRRLAAEGKDIVLFGDGEERRDHVDVEDVGELVRLIVLRQSTGIANAVSGTVVSFRELAEYAAEAFAPRVAVKGSPRSGPMPHDGYRAFDNAAITKAFPGFSFKSWREGVKSVHDLAKAQVTK